jgi:hypothetical protein
MIEIPEDFPRDPFPTVVGGTQPKLAGRLIDGRLVIGLTADERAQRYAMCHDLVVQLVAYCHRKQPQYPKWSADRLLTWVGNGVRAKRTNGP